MSSRFVLITFVLVSLITSCKKKEEPPPALASQETMAKLVGDWKSHTTILSYNATPPWRFVAVVTYLKITPEEITYRHDCEYFGKTATATVRAKVRLLEKGIEVLEEKTFVAYLRVSDNGGPECRAELKKTVYEFDLDVEVVRIEGLDGGYQKLSSPPPN